MKRQDAMAVATWQAQLGKDPVTVSLLLIGTGQCTQRGDNGSQQLAFLNEVPERHVTINTRSLLSYHSMYTAEKSTELNTQLRQSRIIPGLALCAWVASKLFCCGQQWWPCEAEASETYCKTVLCPPASNEGSMWFVGNNYGINDISKGPHVLAQEVGLGLRLEKAWGKIQQWLVGLTPWRSWDLGNIVFGLSKENRKTDFWQVFSGGVVEEA